MKTQLKAQFSPMMFNLHAKGKFEQKQTPLLSSETRKATTTITTTTTTTTKICISLKNYIS